MSVPVLGVIGPKVNKFKQVSSDDHQMSVAVGVGLTSGIRGVGGTHVKWRPPQTECQIDTCENTEITHLPRKTVSPDLCCISADVLCGNVHMARG